jgi:hypothetical protein
MLGACISFMNRGAIEPSSFESFDFDLSSALPLSQCEGRSSPGQ